MKLKFLFAFFIIAALASCEDNLDEDNVPALQAERNGGFFGSEEMSATNNDDGTLTIVGENRLERLEFTLSDNNTGVYLLGQGESNEAIYTFNNQQQFSTRTGNSTGSVILENSLVEGTVTGSFSFVSYTPDAADTLVMRRGVIYQVPFGLEVGAGSDFRANVNGTALNPLSVNVDETNAVVTVTAVNGANAVTLVFPSDIEIGSYDITGDGDYRASYSDGATTATATTGSLDITLVNANDRTINGTFSFESGPPENIVVSNGFFRIEL
jgi:hypothetical protein